MLPLPVGESLTEGLALIEIVMLFVEDAVLEGVVVRVKDTLAVIDTLSGSVLLLEGVSLAESVTEGDMETDSCRLLLAVVVRLLVAVGESDIVDRREGLKDLEPERLIVGVSVWVLEVEGGTPIVPAKL